MTKVLILGGSGMLGSAMLRLFARSEGLDAIAAVRDSAACSLLPAFLHDRLRTGYRAEEADAILGLMVREGVDVVINCVGIIKQRDEAYDAIASTRINALFPHILAQYCEWMGVRLIHISTDCVFDGKQGGYTEDFPADAQDLYGRSKHLGEVVNQVRATTLRTSIIGHELASNRSLIDWFLSQSGEVRGFTRAIFSGLPTVELARVIRDYVLPAPQLQGLYHVAAAPIDKCHLLTLVRKAYDHDVEIRPDDTVRIDRSLDAARFRVATGYVAADWPELVGQMHSDYQALQASR